MIKVLLALIVSTTICFCAYRYTENMPTPPVEIGRYVVVYSPHVERDTFLLDTVTGKSWQMTELSFLNGSPPAWEPVPELNTKEDWKAVVQLYGEASTGGEGSPQSEWKSGAPLKIVKESPANQSELKTNPNSLKLEFSDPIVTPTENSK